MIKLKPIAEQVLQEADEMPTWGEVKAVFQLIVNKENDAERLAALKTAGKSGFNLALSFIPGGGLVSFVKDALEVVDTIEQSTDLAKAMLTVGKSMSKAQLKNPKSSEFKKLTAPFWDAVRLDPEVSIILDDQIENQFINQVILPNLQKPGAENEKIPNMNYELGKWLNSQGLKNADIFFKGKEGDL